MLCCSCTYAFQKCQQNSHVLWSRIHLWNFFYVERDLKESVCNYHFRGWGFVPSTWGWGFVPSTWGWGFMPSTFINQNWGCKNISQCALLLCWLESKASPHWECGEKLYYRAWSYLVCLYIFMCRTFIHRRVHGRFYGRLSWRFQENSTWLCYIWKWSSIMKKTAADSIETWRHATAW